MSDKHIDHPPMQGAKLAIGTVAVSLATFMNVLDTSIANVSIPTISGNLGVSSDQGTWVITSFAVSNAIALPLTGWLSQRLGQVRLFVSSTVLFVIASWLCGLAPNLPFLLFSRVLQGAVAGPMIPLSQSLLLAAFPKNKAPLALALWSMTTLTAPVAGPILGGWISDNYTWPWIFYVNIPVGILAILGTWAIFRDRESATHKLPIDKVGLFLLVVWVGALQIMLDKGKDLDWFNSPVIIALATTSALAFVYFVAWELTDRHPIVDLSLFKLRSFSAGAAALSVAYGLYFANIVLLPLWLQTNVGYRATDAGLVLAPAGLVAVALTPFTGKLVGRFDPRLIATVSLLAFAACFFWRANYTSDVDPWSLTMPTLVQGVGLATLFVPLLGIILSGLPASRIAAASGLSNFLRILCGGIGTSIFQTAWDHRSILHHAQLNEVTTNYNPVFQQFTTQVQHVGTNQQQAYGIFNYVLDQQAAQLGVDDLFYISAILFLVLIGLLWIAKRPGHGGGDDASAAASGAH
ncbi:DHA2 family efflux MFS transporter permease subunit [Dyella flava]|uniref:DHA2 family efflux MFS transporter permease subunit n=1 Tax=Dyella flava TaxID=1920170 RepID=A0ABS2K1L6_9GAMM|nr:DHA2 family efflux MFS transporter permease subunit [Dyella flava]MBM7125151.1 DHA2 family efflux MFS transporter permease subunit [Dyella flava]GLQ52025.1 MFS transporter [Dyella flava]